MRRRRLTTEQVNELVHLFRSGVTAGELARVYRVSPRAVVYRLAARGCRYRRTVRDAVRVAAEERRGMVNRLRGQGLSIEQMAGCLGLRTWSCREWMLRNMPGLCAQMRGERAPARPKATPPAPAPRHRRTPVARRRPRRAPQGARLRRDYLAGYSIRAIARHYLSHPWTVWRVLHRLGVPLRPRTKRSPRWLAAMRQQREQRRAR